MQRAIMFLLAASFVGCVGGNGDQALGSIDVSVSAHVHGTVTDACYNVEVTNGAGDVLWTKDEVCASTFGFDTSVTYVGVCDATSNDHTVSIELASLLDADGNAITDFLNPCPVGDACTQMVTCEENEDVPVRFDLTALVDSEQGFLDILVGLDFIECSAKLDCTDANGDPLLLLHDANGVRGETVVLGLACLWDDCPMEGMWFYSDDIVVTCDEGTATVTPNGMGPATITQTANILYAAHFYDGDLKPGFFRNVALGFDMGTNCTVTTSATVIDEELPGMTLPGETHPIIQWNVPLSDGNGDLTCTQHPLNGPDGYVAGVFPDTLDEREFDYEEFRSNECCETINFEDLVGGTITPIVSTTVLGQMVDIEVDSWINSSNDCGSGDLVIFDTSVPSVPDPDLVLAGQSVMPNLGNVLAHQSCNSATVPNDADVETVIRFTFPMGMYTVAGFDALDQEANEQITVEVGGIQVGGTTPMLNNGDKVESVVIDPPAPFTSELDFKLLGSGAIDNIEICL